MIYLLFFMILFVYMNILNNQTKNAPVDNDWLERNGFND